MRDIIDWSLIIALAAIAHVLSYGLAHHVGWHRWYWELLGVM